MAGYGHDWAVGQLVAEAKAESNVQDLGLYGLDGDRDGDYILEGAIHCLAASGGAIYSLRPQGLTTNQTGRVRDESGALATVAIVQLALGINLTPGPITLDFVTRIKAQRTIGGVASWRRFYTIAQLHHNQVSPFQLNYDASGNWRETATNLTDLHLFSSVAGSILTGSQLKLYRAISKWTP